ncbi:MAG: MMPL family transporter, partial [Nitrosomonas sp.]|nr:MMPL family transporter [Nitrosomonas sp.]
WPDSQNPDHWEGVIEVDMIAPSMVDNIEQGGLGTVNFSWLMPQPPTNEEDAIAIRDRAARIPFLHDTLVSADGKAIALYLPLTSKDVSYEVRKALLEYVADWEYTGDQVYITGLPVAEDTFGVEMFVQMAVSAPLAMLVIFLLLWWFFRNFMLIISPMVVALVCSLSTMALLVISGNTVHIMSSMIPIFIMPIAVLDSVHILSEFFDRYPQIKDRRRTIEQVMQHLFQPMLFTTLTTIAGFASLALTPIPPVQVFGIFIALGVFLAWFWTIIFIPAFIMLMPEHKLADFGHTRNDADNISLMNKILQRTGKLTYQHARKIISGTVLLAVIAIWGISLIQVNDNPVKWFVDSHPIRVADRVLNEHFGGTYMAYLQFEQSADNEPTMEYEQALKQRLVARKIKAIENNYYSATSIFDQIIAITTSESYAAVSGDALLTKLSTIAETSLDAASDEEYDTWDDVLLFLDQERQRSEIFKKPEVLGYLDSLQQHLSENDIVGKSNSVVDVVKTVHRELLLGKDEAFRIPETTNAVAQTLVTYQNSHRPQDLWHFVTPDYRKAVLWLQLTSGDNRDMETVINDVEAFVIDNPPPFGL